MTERPDAADAAGILEAIETDRRRAQDALAPDPRVQYGVWGAAWIIGFGAALLGFAPEPALPLPVALGLAGAALVAAIVITTVHAVRRGRGTRGPSNLQGAIHGNAFAFGFLLIGLLGWRLIDAGTPTDAMFVYWVVATCLVVGTLGLAGAALVNDRSTLVFSAWVIVVGIAAALIPAPWLLLAGVGGGLGFVVLAIIAGAKPALLAGEIAARHG